MAHGRILTTHVGSLIRPPDLVTLMRARIAGEAVDDKKYAKVLEKSVKDVVKQQAKIGLDIIDDGEFRKTGGWFRYAVERMEGVVKKQDKTLVTSVISGRDRKAFTEFYKEYDGAQRAIPAVHYEVTGPLAYKPAAIRRDVAEMKTVMKGVKVVDAFMTAVAPASALPEVSLERKYDHHYKTEAEAMFAVADVMNQEYRAIVEAGFMVQIDDAFLATNWDVMDPAPTLKQYRKWTELQIEILNFAVRGLPEDRTRYHICWGSWQGPHTQDLEFSKIADIVMKLKVGGYSLEMANPRHEHEWRVWEDVKLPEGRVLVPGVVTHSTNVVEHPDLVAERITRLAKLVGRDRVVASTDCGFAQGPFTRRVHPTIQWAKLETLVEGAHRASKTLWAKGAKDKGSVKKAAKKKAA